MHENNIWIDNKINEILNKFYNILSHKVNTL